MSAQNWETPFPLVIDKQQQKKYYFKFLALASK